MADKKLFTREEFAALLRESAEAMAQDAELRTLALEVLTRADRYRWIHQTSWLGQPVLNLPQDLFALQEIIYRTRPACIIEVGVAWGGSLLFYSTLMECLGGGSIIGIDTYIPDDLRARLQGYGKLSERLELVNGSSLDEAVVAKVKALVGGRKDVMVVLDSYHTHDHVLKELNIYSQFVGRGHYLICCDTVVENLPVQEHRDRPWHPGNSPMTAVREFLRLNPRFQVDQSLVDKLLFTCNPGGYLHCTE